MYDDDGFNTINEQHRISLRTGLSAQVSENLSYASSSAFSSNWYTRDYNANSGFSRFSNAEGGDFGDLSTYTPEELEELRLQQELEASLTDITESVRRFQTSQSLTWTPFKGFTARGTVGLDNRSSKNEEVASNALLISKGAEDPGTADQGSYTLATRNFIGLTSDLNLQYQVDAGDFSFITGAGGQFFREQDEQVRITSINLIEGTSLFGNTADQTVEDFVSVLAFGGFYFSENIGYKNKLFLDAAVRWDGNSAFGESIGLLPIFRVGLAYSLTDEPFMQEGRIADIISRFSIRANFGQSTNFPTPFARDLLFAANPFNGGVGYTFGNPGNPDLSAEIVDSYEAGFDASFFDARVSVGFTYYDNTTNDAIFTPTAAPSTGQLDQETNIGVVTNKGIELQTAIDVIRTNDMTLSLNASITTNENIVTDAGGSPEFVVGGFQFLGSFVKEGSPLGYLRGSMPIFSEEGVLVDNVPNSFLGDPNPDGYGTVGMNFRWKNLTVFANGDYQYGAQGVAVDDVLRFFGGVNDEGRIPDPNVVGSDFVRLAGVWVEDTDFFKLRNLGASYRVPIQSNTISQLTLGFSTRNPIVWASSRFDPEVTGSGIGRQGAFGVGGFGYGTESAPRQYVFNVKVGF